MHTGGEPEGEKEGESQPETQSWKGLDPTFQHSCCLKMSQVERRADTRTDKCSEGGLIDEDFLFLFNMLRQQAKSN